jgi:beta-glucosidase
MVSWVSRWYARALLALCSFLFFSVLWASDDADQVETRVNEILSKMTLEEKIDQIHIFQGGNDLLKSIPRLGVPQRSMADGPFGIKELSSDAPSASLPGGINLAATWDRDLVKKVGVVLGQEARAHGVNVIYAPGVNIYRAPMAGRTFEYFGEDPFLAGQTAVAYIKGVQSQHVCPTVKHFVGNDQEFDRDHSDSVIDERTLREIYLAPFEAAVKEAHVCGIMASYNSVNGQYLSENARLKNDIVKNEWHFDGFIISDSGATHDGIAAVNSGLDVDNASPPDDPLYMIPDVLVPAIKLGKVQESTIDDHVRRILRKSMQMGWFDEHYTPVDRSIPLYNEHARAVALEAARSGMVLLKNEQNLLPFRRNELKTLAVIGPNAYPARLSGAGGANVRPWHAVSFLEGIANYLGDATTVTYDSGVPPLFELAHSTHFQSAAAGGSNGLRLQGYSSPDLSGSVAVDGLDEHVDHHGSDLKQDNLSNNIRSARWTGYYLAEARGSYVVFIQGRGQSYASRLVIDGKTVFDNWTGVHASILNTSMDFDRGPHRIVLEVKTVSDPGAAGTERGLLLSFGIVKHELMVSEAARELARHAQAVVLAVGFNREIEGEGSDRPFALPAGQDELIKTILSLNKNTIVVNTSGGAVDMRQWIDDAPAVIQAWYAGQEGGTALAQLLFGEFSPSGKLPITFDRSFEDSATNHSFYPEPGTRTVRYSEGIFLGYRHYDRSAKRPLFCFGHGLSYTTFEYDQAVVDHRRLNSQEEWSVSFNVKNVGNRDGAEIAQVYVSDNHSPVPRPVKELKGFVKVSLAPHESRRVSVPLDRRSFSYYDVNLHDWVVTPGQFEILVGSSASDIRLKTAITVGAP